MDLGTSQAYADEVDEYVDRGAVSHRRKGLVKLIGDGVEHG
jgi:hypothetical protein